MTIFESFHEKEVIAELSNSSTASDCIFLKDWTEAIHWSCSHVMESWMSCEALACIRVKCILDSGIRKSVNLALNMVFSFSSIYRSIYDVS